MMEFQIYDFLEDHEKRDKSNTKEYIIHIFGRKLTGESVYAKLTGFKPYFYILIPDDFQKSSVKFLENLKVELVKIISDLITYKYYPKPDITLEKSKKADYFCNEQKFYFYKLEFICYYHLTKYKNFIENNLININNKKYNFKLYEADLSPMLRCFHINNINGCSWVNVIDFKYINNFSLCDIEIETKFTNIKQIDKSVNAPLRICSFDIECYSCDGNFPQASRESDKIIQIGYTYTYLGESKPYRKYIGVLKETKKFDNDTILKCFETEKELLYDFQREITSKEGDCDIITGYNIYFFDEKYIFERSKLFDLDINYLSKLNNHKCRFIKDMKLASAALGENVISIWNTPGRVHIDLMKDIQRTYNLTSYKLDNVSAYFIRGKILEIKYDNNNYCLICNNVNDINKNDYIHIEIDKGVISDEIGDKFLVVEINYENKYIYITDNNNYIKDLYESDIKYNLIWSQAKDDITPTDIFKSYTGSSSDRSIIAKYCIKDCLLVNVLINKLESISKNIEMANVCCVPLSYLFTRGQGIKIFSLCLKEFRKHEYIFPVTHYNNSKCEYCKKKFVNTYRCIYCDNETIQQDNIKLDDEYEGAIVIEPIPAIEYEALAVKDYSSLYPSSIIQKNISHETMVLDEKYENMKNIKYHIAEYKDSNNNIKKCIFAKKDNKLGVLPSILYNLLNERKLIKKKMKHETDSFKYSILNAKQLAVKITANSLYGQLGSVFSHIKRKELAASTTSTGREMLLYAKKYDEERLPIILNTLKYYYNINDQENIDNIYIKENISDENIKDSIKHFLITTNNITLQPIVRYGDTDSIFSCYRFKINSIKITDELYNIQLVNKVLLFSYKLLEPYLDLNIKSEIYNIYKKKILNNKSINIPILEEKKKNIYITFVKEYLEEKFIPLLWTITEIIQKNQIKMFDIKFIPWLDQLFNKYNFNKVDLYTNRKKQLCEILEQKLNDMYNSNSNELIEEKTKIVLYIKDLLSEKQYYLSELYDICEIHLFKNIKEKWEYSIYNKNLITIINTYLKSIIINYTKNSQLINILLYKLIKFKSIDISLLLDFKVLYKDIDLIENNLFLEKSNEFIIIFNKNNGRKTMLEIIESFIKTGLNINFNEVITNHYSYITEFINNNLTYYENNIKNYIWLHSRFFDNNIVIDIYKGGDIIQDKTNLELTIELGKISGNMIKYLLEWPHDCEYEKTYYPFIILKKKKYVGNKYEFDSNKYSQDYTGIVLKRRDNAPIVKEICGGIINCLINRHSKEYITKYVKLCLENMFNNKYNIKYFLQTRNLKSKDSYKDWTKIAHIVLADRISRRDIGNEIQTGSRLEFAVIKTNNKKNKLQGDIIEEKSYIINNNLEIDYLHYLTNQIMNPALQFLELIDDSFKDLFGYYINEYPKKPIILLIDNIHNIIKILKSNKQLTLHNKFIKNYKTKITFYIDNIKKLI